MPKFKASKYLTAKQKHNITKAWDRFLLNGFQRRHLTKALYRYLHCHLGFIAYYNIDHFWNELFTEEKIDSLLAIINLPYYYFEDDDLSIYIRDKANQHLYKIGYFSTRFI